MGKRIRQKGVKCLVEGCDKWCRSKGLCINHSMALRRYGDVRGGKVSREGVCKQCGSRFRLIKSNQEYCDIRCYHNSEKGREITRKANKDYAMRNKEKIFARGIFRRKPL